MDFSNMFGGDWNSGMMQGFQMAAMMEQRQAQQQRLKQEAANARLLNEERMLKMKEQRRQMEGRDKLVKQFMPQTVTQKSTEDVGLLDAPVETTTTQESPLFTAISGMYGGDKAELARQIMAADPDMGIKMLQGLKPETLKDRFMNVPAGGTVWDASTQQVAFQGQPKSGSIYSDFASGYKAKLRAEHPEWSDAQLNLATAEEASRRKMNEQRSILEVRYPTKSQATNLPAGYVFDRRTGKYSAPDGTEVAPNEFANLFGEGATQKSDMSALRDLTKRRELIGSFTSRIDANTKVVENLATKYGNTDARLLNIPINKLKQYMGSGEYASLQLALRSLSNEIAKVESGSLGIAEVSVQQSEAMNKIHDPNLSIADMIKVLETGKLLSKTSMGAIDSQVSNLKGRMKGNTGAYNINQPYATSTNSQGKTAYIDTKEAYEELEANGMLPPNVKINTPSTPQPSGQTNAPAKVRRGAEFNKNVAYLKMARNREEAKAKIRALAQQGWKPEELTEIARSAGWE